MSVQLCEDIQEVGMGGDQRSTTWKLMNEQRREGLLCDVTFQCNGGEVRAHKCFLATVSEFFKVLFTSPLSTASSTNTVEFHDFSLEVVILLLDVIYWEVDIPALHVVELLRLADYVQLHWLVDLLIEN